LLPDILQFLFFPAIEYFIERLGSLPKGNFFPIRRERF
jgi:hypothetical protein